jgi:hypothetical protein
VVVNEFGTLSLDLRRPSLFLVPAASSRVGLPSPPVPGGVDHFTCYQIRGARFRLAGISVVDEFGNYTADAKRPVRLCVPTDKNGEGVGNATDHLLCYEVRSKPRRAELSAPVFLATQFGTKTLGVPGSGKVTRTTELCVRSSQ